MYVYIYIYAGYAAALAPTLLICAREPPRRPESRSPKPSAPNLETPRP